MILATKVSEFNTPLIDLPERDFPLLYSLGKNKLFQKPWSGRELLNTHKEIANQAFSFKLLLPGAPIDTSWSFPRRATLLTQQWKQYRVLIVLKEKLQSAYCMAAARNMRTLFCSSQNKCLLFKLRPDSQKLT